MERLLSRDGDGVQEREDRYESLFKNNEAVMLLTDVETATIVDANHAACRFYGYSREEIIGKPLSEINTLSETELRKEMEGILSEQRRHFKFKHRMKSGEVRDVEVFSGPMVVEGRLHMHGIVFDVTDRNQTRRALRRSETLFRNAFMYAGIGKVIMTSDRRIIDANPAYLRMLGYSMDELEDVNVEQLTYPEDRHFDAELARELVSGTRNSYETEKRYLTRDGRVVHVEIVVSAVRDETGAILYLIGQAQDVTEKKQAQRALRVSEERLALAIEGADLGLWDWNVKTGEVTYNENWAHMLGYELDDLEPSVSTWSRLLHPDDVAPTMQELNAHLKGTTPFYQSEHRLRARDGSWRWVLDTGRVMERAPDGTPIRAIGIHLDITRQKRTEAELIRAREHAEEMNRLKDAFLANMSHEIRTPLTSVIGYADLLREEVIGSARGYAELVRQGGQRLMDTLNSVLDLAQLRSGMVRLGPEVLVPASEIRSALQLFEQHAESKGLRLALEIGDHCPEKILIDRAALGRIVNNLVSNAIKFTEEGGVTIRISGVKDTFVLEVEDTGVGMSEEYLNHLFEEFSQESVGLGRKYEGNGLGLAITKNLVQLMGGHITVQSRQNIGTVFTVEIPIVLEEASENPANGSVQDESNHDEDDLKVLVVDDDPNARHLVSYVLSKKADTIDEAASAAEAIALMDRKSYDLVLLDMNLGSKKSGLDVLNHLRRLPGYETTPVVAMTAYALPGDGERFIANGFTSYLSKPFVREQLLQVLTLISPSTHLVDSTAGIR